MPELEQRVTGLEADMAQVREEWATVQQAPLLNARLLNALRETQVEHGRTLAEHGRTLAEHGRTLAEHGRRLDEVDRKLELLGQGQQTIIGMLDTLIAAGAPDPE